MFLENSLYSDFAFKAERDYVHGTTIYDFLLDNISGIGGGGGDLLLDLVFHKLARKNLCFTMEKPQNLEDIVLTLKCQNKKEKIKIFATEYEKNIVKRIPYNEDEITNKATFSDNQAIISKNSNYSFIEHLVSLNKSLLSKIFDDIKGKFYFSRLELKEGFIRDFSSIQLFYQSHFNYQLMKTIVFVDKREIGYIYFSCKRS
ncbi:hypothetical protein LS70_003365 [Helicobacter sp. MIT 11-5569]|uniref:hypothetical protein n=1 Tax=Helicobacter sp. MIT 11-5569 TaxID=1548151 RepID=UPI0010FF3504|nr:hypothetical protein [Helicobacter sp. MIT 11-5569]TLD84599.1 hypothetical protein LS70_003365 [Helicobacter sp. MIT 11-5569]